MHRRRALIVLNIHLRIKPKQPECGVGCFLIAGEVQRRVPMVVLLLDAHAAPVPEVREYVAVVIKGSLVHHTYAVFVLDVHISATALNQVTEQLTAQVTCHVQRCPPGSIKGALVDPILSHLVDLIGHLLVGQRCLIAGSHAHAQRLLVVFVLVAEYFVARVLEALDQVLEDFKLAKEGAAVDECVPVLVEQKDQLVHLYMV